MSKHPSLLCAVLAFFVCLFVSFYIIMYKWKHTVGLCKSSEVDNFSNHKRTITVETFNG